MGAAFAYDTYTNPSKNNGVLRATLTHQSRIHSLLVMALLDPTIKCRVVDANHSGKPYRTHARAIKGCGNFLPFAKRRAHTPRTVLLENFPC